MKILITSGGTKVPIDDVRYIGNMSSGRFGAELASQFEFMGHDLIFFNAKGSIQPKADIHYQGRMYIKNIQYKDYYEYKNVLEIAKSEQPDLIISAAAVSDYIVDKTEGKISSNSDELIITLKKAEKILPQFKTVCPYAKIIGFKLLVSPTFDQVYEAVRKVLNNGADYVVYNDLTEIKKGNTTRLLFNKEMEYQKANNARELVELIRKETVIFC